MRLFVLAASSLLLLQGIAATPVCDATHIQALDMNCDCEKHQDKCPLLKTCPACPGAPQINRATTSCNSKGCTNDQLLCKSCGLYFSTLCNCLKGNTPTGAKPCVPSGKGKNNWYFIDTTSGTPIYTTNELVTGIEDMGAAGEPGWTFAQSHNQQNGKKGLVINSYMTRSNEQIHIHSCTQTKEATDKLNQEKVTDFKGNTPKELAKTKGLYCVSEGKAPVNGWAAIIKAFYANPPKGVCKNAVSAGIVRDKDGNSWGCFTSNEKGGEAEWCAR